MYVFLFYIDHTSLFSPYEKEVYDNLISVVGSCLSWPGMQAKAECQIHGLIFVRQTRTVWGMLKIITTVNKLTNEQNVR
jgi:hypothetical protein